MLPALCCYTAKSGCIFCPGWWHFSLTCASGMIAMVVLSLRMTFHFVCEQVNFKWCRHIDSEIQLLFTATKISFLALTSLHKGCWASPWVHWVLRQMLMLNFSLLLCPFRAFYVQKETSTADDYCLLMVFLITDFQDTKLTFC